MTDLTPVVIDYETYYDKDYNLKKLPTVLYVRDPRFHVHGVSIKVGDNPTQWFRDVDVTAALNRLDWPQICLIGHNLYFDAMILVEHYGHRPARYFDTLFAAKMLMPAGVRHDLDTVARALGLSGKIQGTLASLMGVRHLTDEQHTALGIYGNADVDQTYGVYNRLLPLVPEEERYVFHMTTRMGVDSPIRLDQDILREEIDLAKARRAARIDENGFDLDTLTSNDKFLNLLKTLVPEDELPFKQNAKNQTIPALGKTDAQWVRFKLDHPELQALCEAREAAKSNIMLRRPELYLQIAQTSRGTLPMAYNAWGAHTGRFSGRDRLNVQNMPNLHRSKLRLALVAPPEHVIHVADSSQIELRLQLWFSGQLDILEELANGGDPYSRVASAIYKRPITKANKLERGVGKATELGCFTGDTQVLTDQGWTPITNVQPRHRVWDGTAWVSTEGVICQGQKNIIRWQGIGVTPDHLILTPNSWVSASRVASASIEFQRSASALAHCAWNGTTWVPVEASAPSTSLAHAPTTSISTQSVSTPCSTGNRPDAPIVRASSGAKNTPSTRTSSLSSSIGSGCSTEFPPASIDATTQTTKGTPITAGEGFTSTSLGAKTDARSSPISSRSTDGTSTGSSSIGSTTGLGTSRATSASCPGSATAETSVPSPAFSTESPSSNEKSLVYDLLECGPRNRFTILTELGPVVVHNCQYGMGPPKFRQYMAGGPLGLDPIFFSEIEAQNAVAGYRATHPMTIAMWDTLNRMIPLMAQSNCNVELGPVTFRHEHILLPNGTCLDYTGLRPTEEGGWAYGVNGLTKYLWGGTLLENIVQALARVVVVDQAVIIDREIAPVIGWTHDENLVLGHENGAEERQKAIEEVMKRRPHWAPDLPLDAEGGFDRAYSK